MQKDIENAKIDIIEELGINKLPKEERDTVLIQISEIMQQRIMERFAIELPEEKQTQFLEIISNENTRQKTIDTFITANLPQSEELVLEEIGKYKEESVEMFKQLSRDNK